MSNIGFQNHYDLIVVGKGFSALMVIKKAIQKKLNFCVVAKNFGFMNHFNGAFDVVDPRIFDPHLNVLQSPSLPVTLDKFVKAYPTHVYAQVLEDLNINPQQYLKELSDFFSFYQMPVVGSLIDPVMAFGSTGHIKPVAAAYGSHGIQISQLKNTQHVLFVSFPYLNQYPTEQVMYQLKKVFPHVALRSYEAYQPNPVSPMVDYIKYFDDIQNQNEFISFLKKQFEPVGVIVLPPVMGIENHDAFIHRCEQELNVNVIELLPMLPSITGLRCVKHMANQLDLLAVPIVSGEVCPLTRKDILEKKVQIKTQHDQLIEFNAGVCVMTSASAEEDLSATSSSFCRNIYKGLHYTQKRCWFGEQMALALKALY